MVNSTRWTSYPSFDILSKRQYSGTEEVAVLDVVGYISHRDFSFMDHGNWSPTSEIPFDQHRGTFLLNGTNRSEVIRSSWENVLQNIRTIEGLGRSPNSTTYTSVVKDGDLLIGHRLFNVSQSIMLILTYSTDIRNCLHSNVSTKEGPQ